MAKWGEGDPRWIVEERPDATNVNNWHWTEKNATPWSIDKLKSMFAGFKIAENDTECIIEEITKIQGEASASNRKSKLIFFYEWKLTMKWSGTLADGGTGGGVIDIPNLSEENSIQDIDITISVSESTSDSEQLKQFMYNNSRERIRQHLALYIRELRNEFSKGMILPRKDGDESTNSKTTKPDSVVTFSSGFNKKIDISAGSTESKSKAKATDKVGCKLDVETLDLCERFQCRATELYEALTTVERVTAFSRGHVKMDPTKGGDFWMFGGNITGKFEELIPNKKITQSWRYKPWAAGHFSTVTMEFDEKADHTQLRIKQTGIPKSELEMTRQNWERYYWTSIRQTFGFGSYLV